MKFLIKFALLKGGEVVEGEDIVWASDVRHALLLTEPDHDALGAVVESVTPLEDDAQVEPD